MEPRNAISISEVDRYGLPMDFVICQACGTIRIDPYLDDASLRHFYTHLYQQMYARTTDVANYFERQQIKIGRIFATYRNVLNPGAAVLEVGCGAGGGLSVFAQHGFATSGCDYDRELIDHGRARGVQNLTRGSMAEIRVERPAQCYDLIYLYHVFEHTNNPVHLLGELKSVLKSDGRILIVVPDISQIATSVWPGGDTLQFLHLAHKFNYSYVGMQRMGARSGLQMRLIQPVDHYPKSRCSEMWIEFSHRLFDQPATVEGELRIRSGRDMYRYLRRTERLFRLGVSPAQMKAKFQRLAAYWHSVVNWVNRKRAA